MAGEIDDVPARRTDMVLGQDLAALSVDELRHRIDALKAEIGRIEGEIGKKSAHRDAAASMFRLAGRDA